MTKTEKNNNHFEYFWEDSELFFLWQFTQDKLLPYREDKPILDANKIIPDSYYRYKKYFDILSNFIEVDKEFDFYIYNDSERLAKFRTTDELLSKYKKSDHKKILDIARKIGKKPFQYSELCFIKNLLPEGMFSDIFLIPKDGKNQEDTKLKETIDAYIDRFISGELLIDESNYYNFQKNKELFIKHIRDIKALEQYGKNFIVSSHATSSPFKHDKNTLFVHTIYTLEFLGYIKVISLRFEEDRELFTKYKYHINILPNETFRELVYEDYRKENPKSMVESYDSKKSILTFAGKKIAISKSGKETDQTLLMGSLMKTKGDDWMHNDEILEDWGNNDEDQKKLPKNKVYFACQKVNTTIQLQTGIDDFLEITTAKARINPKYKKVDE